MARRVGWLVEQGSSAQEAVSEALEFMERKVGGEGGGHLSGQVRSAGSPLEQRGDGLGLGQGHSPPLRYREGRRLCG